MVSEHSPEQIALNEANPRIAIVRRRATVVTVLLVVAGIAILGSTIVVAAANGWNLTTYIQGIGGWKTVREVMLDLATIAAGAFLAAALTSSVVKGRLVAAAARKPDAPDAPDEPDAPGAT